MSKKSTPELLGDEEFLRQHHLMEMSVGARQVFRLAKILDKNSHDKPATAGELFNGGFFYGADEIGVEFRKAGFPKYPVRATMAELEKIAERYVGEAPDIKNPRNLRASYAWVLAHFAEAEYYRQKFISEKDFIELWGTGVLMGRLVEWWLWRREGHDADAVRGEGFDPKRPRLRTGRRTSRHKLRRNKNIIQRAQKLLQMGEARFTSSGKINISTLADLVRISLKLDIKDTSIKVIIRKALHDGKLTD
jgi:hypothetical protein